MNFDSFKMNAKSKRCSSCGKVKDRNQFVDYQGAKSQRGRYCEQCRKQKEMEARHRHFDGIVSVQREYVEKYKIIFGDDWESKAWPNCLRLFLFMERDSCPYRGLSFKGYQEGKDYFECSEKFHIDHMDPLELGGEDSIRNAVSVCKDCNLQKGRTAFLSWLERLNPFLKEISRKIYIEKHGFSPEEFIQGEPNVKSRATGVYGLLSLDKQELINMKIEGQLW